MRNTEFDILAEAHACSVGVTALDLVRAFYKNSQQPLKKAKTMFGYLRRLQRRGLMVSRGPATARQFTELRFEITPLGRQLGRAEQRRRRDGRAEPPIMRLVTE